MKNSNWTKTELARLKALRLKYGFNLKQIIDLDLIKGRSYNAIKSKLREIDSEA